MKIYARITAIILFIFDLNGQNIKEVKGLEVGSTAPVFEAVDAGNNIFSLKEALKSGPVVLIFYRGYWCPVCNKHLGSLQDSLKMIEENEACVIAISLKMPEYLNKMAKKTGTQFKLLYDKNYAIAKAYDVNFMPDILDRMSYNIVLEANLKKTHSDDSQGLPIPAAYIIEPAGKIVWRQFDPDYHKRSSVQDILTALDDLSGE